MKEKPIIFSTELIPKILDGTKTMTRRVIKQTPDIFAGDIAMFKDFQIRHCPYGQVGDRLWVRETHLYYTDPFAIECFVGFRDGTGKSVDDFPEGSTVVNMASDPRNWKWRPSIHMPKWASRITLEITEVRVERLQEITEEDAIAEGVSPTIGELMDKKATPLLDFECLWDSLNAKRGYGWDTNPWVWVIGFKKEE